MFICVCWVHYHIVKILSLAFRATNLVIFDTRVSISHCHTCSLATAVWELPVPSIISVLRTSLSFPSFTFTLFPTLRALDPKSRQLGLMPYVCSEMLLLCHYTASSLSNNSQNPTLVQFKVETYPPSNVIPRILHFAGFTQFLTL
jgi:hypothetical protein